MGDGFSCVGFTMHVLVKLAGPNSLGESGEHFSNSRGLLMRRAPRNSELTVEFKGFLEFMNTYSPSRVRICRPLCMFGRYFHCNILVMLGVYTDGLPYLVQMTAFDVSPTAFGHLDFFFFFFFFFF